MPRASPGLALTRRVKGIQDHGTIISTKGVVKQFAAQSHVVGVDLDVEENETVAIIVPTGGKTTFLNILTGLYIPEEGRVFFRGKDVTNQKPGPGSPRGS